MKKWAIEKLNNHKGMKGLKHNSETILKMKAKAKLRGNNGISEQLKGIPRPKNVLEKMKATMFKKGQIAINKGKPNFKIRGENNHNWKGGISKTNARKHIMMTLEYKLWRRGIFERDNYTCVWCGIRGAILQADHIKPWALFPELRFALDNGRTLCKECHKTTYTYGAKSIKKF